jgi:hypothetical protein
MRIANACFLILLFGQLIGTAQIPQSSITGVQQVSAKDVVSMKHAGLSDDIVIAKIRQHNQPSDLTTDELISLKTEKVSDAVIRALMDPRGTPSVAPNATVPAISNRLLNVNPSGATPEAGQSAVGDPNDPMTPHDSGIYLFKNESGHPHMTALERTAYQGTKTGGAFSSAMTYGIAKVRTKAVIPGKSAALRVGEGKPTFYFYFEDKAAGLGRGFFAGANVSNPNQFALLRLNVEKHDRSTEIGAFSMWGGSTGSREKSMVPFRSERIGPGFYKVQVESELKSGEYCFVATSGVAGAYGSGATFAHDLFDFGVDTR